MTSLEAHLKKEARAVARDLEEEAIFIQLAREGNNIKVFHHIKRRDIIINRLATLSYDNPEAILKAYLDMFQPLPSLYSLYILQSQNTYTRNYLTKITYIMIFDPRHNSIDVLAPWVNYLVQRTLSLLDVDINPLEFNDHIIYL